MKGLTVKRGWTRRATTGRRDAGSDPDAYSPPGTSGSGVQNVIATQYTSPEIIAHVIHAIGAAVLQASVLVRPPYRGMNAASLATAGITVWPTQSDK